MKTLRPQMSRGATVLNMSPRGSPLGSSVWGSNGTFKWWSLLHADWVTSKSHLVGECGSVGSRLGRAQPFLCLAPISPCFPLTCASHTVPTGVMQCSQRCPLRAGTVFGAGSGGGGLSSLKPVAE